MYVNRRLGRLLASLAYRLGLTPNHATAISAVHTVGGLCAILLLPPSLWSGMLAAVLLVLGYAWDSADGQLARLRGGGSLSGEWLDHFVDAFKLASIHLVVLIALWWHTTLRDTVWLLVPIVFSVIQVVTFFGMLLNDLLKNKIGVESTHSRGGGTLGRSLILAPTDFGILCLLFAVWGATTVFLGGYLILCILNGGFLVLAAIKWFREIRSLETIGG